jgi:DNA-directed RNA polymerase subunit RPC12/RpoP
MDGDHTRAERDRTDDDRAGEAARLDGNVAAGMLSEIFVQDFTTARVTCANCGAARPLGALLVYAHGMGMVMRCTTCDSVVMRMARTPTRLWFDPTGARLLTMAAPVTAVV